MKKIILLLLMVLLGGSGIAQTGRAPNIIVFLVDDMGWMDTSVPFADSIMPLNQRYHTPNMKRLAAEGVKFTNAYAQPVCTPSRTSMLTGMNAARTRVTNWTSPNKNVDSDVSDDQFAALSWNRNGLSSVPGIVHTVYATPFPQLLKDAGYYTIQVGKAHWGAAGTPGANPYNLGFMVNIAGHAGGHPQSYLSEQHYGNMPGKAQLQAVPDLEEYYDTHTFLTEALTREALKALERPIRRGEPFYLNMCQYAVHTPIMADPRFVQRYYNAGLDSVEAAYASLVEGMDKSLGDIMDYLQSKRVAGNTIIIFMSDNGGLDHHQRGGLFNTHNYPLRSGKGAVYEGGIREPMIVKWPGVTRGGTTNPAPVMIEDFFPSILEMAKVGAGRIIQQIDGRSFVPILKTAQRTVVARPLIFHYPNKWIHIHKDEEAKLGINYYTAMRYGHWKLIYRMRTQEFELYDLSKDLQETQNLAETNKDQLKKLALIFGKTLKERSAQMPVEKLTGKPVPFPDEKVQ
ncbi:sulfatase [Niabella sp. CC-SYL272]|uniref:sulfatase n=1 Tax=Niabella agricola TaxID=2891571 RepID=UPI001F369E26|nr:sulfatase [Niabella agricola]MCF3108785.1 sulfatase [Niabella agricola]